MSLFSPEIIVTNTPDVTVSTGVNVNNFPATQPVSGPLTDTQLRASPVPVSSSTASASTSVVTLVTTTGSNQTLLAANVNRKKAILYVESSTQQIKLGTTASTTSYTYKVTASNTTIEIPSEWKGQIDCIGTSGKNILVTELV